MTVVEEVVQIPFFQGLPADVLREISAHSVVLELPRGKLVYSQHAVASHLFFLISGMLQFHIRFEGIDDLMTGTTREPGALLGWSVFRPPHRYTASVRCAEECRVLRLPRETIMNLVQTQPHIGYPLLKRVAASLANRLEQTREILVRPEATGETASAGA